MAGDWIKWCKGLSRKVEVLRIAEYLNLHPDHVAGTLMRFWEWVDDNAHITPDGNGIVTGLMLHPKQVDSLIGVTGFGEALASVGWIKVEGQATVMPNLGRHNGTPAKSRATTAVRVAKHRENKTDSPRETYCIPSAIRSEVYRRDNHRCVYCGRKEGQVGPIESKNEGYFTIDHVVPITRDGAEEILNYVTCCMSCNRFKSNRLPDECGLKWPTDEKSNRYGVTISLLEKRRVLDANLSKNAAHAFPKNVDEVIEYGRSAHCGLTPDESRACFDHYSSTSLADGRWQVQGQPVNDWKARVRTWRNNRAKFERTATGSQKSNAPRDWKPEMRDFRKMIAEGLTYTASFYRMKIDSMKTAFKMLTAEEQAKLEEFASQT